MFFRHTSLHCTIMHWCRLPNGDKIQIVSKYDFLHIQKKYFEIHGLELIKFHAVLFASKSWLTIITFLLEKLLNDKIQFIKEPFGSALWALFSLACDMCQNLKQKTFLYPHIELGLCVWYLWSKEDFCTHHMNVNLQAIPQR